MSDPLPQVSGDLPVGFADQLVEYLVSQMGGLFNQMAEVAKRLRDDEAEQFAAGLRESLHHTVDLMRPDASNDEVQASLADPQIYVESWVISSQLHASESWHSQMKDTASRLETGDLGDPASISDLRQRLHVS